MTPWDFVISLRKEHKISQSETISQDKLISFFLNDAEIVRDIAISYLETFIIL